MSISMQDYILRLRIIYQQVETLTDTEGHLPPVSAQEWSDTLDYAFQVVPELRQHWHEIGVWVSERMALLDAYHMLASQLLEEEDTAKLPATPPLGERRGLLSYQMKNMGTEHVD